jgi:hypothetical protein
MQLVGCPAWEYEKFPGFDDTLTAEATEILVALRSRQIDSLQTASDTRPIHSKLFSKLVPEKFEYYAGHFRGENFRCLRRYEVIIRDDPRVGYPPDSVVLLMQELARRIGNCLRALDAGHQIPNIEMPPEQKLMLVVALACHLFTYFLTIHPYANGNGHAARFLVWSVLGRYGYWPKNWPLHPRPPNPPYLELIVRYRNGEVEPLERYILNSIIGN